MPAGRLLSEAEIIPYYTSQPPGNRVLVLAPHPDDETLGCGGVISLLAEAKKDIRIVFLTSGDRADPSHPLSHNNPSSSRIGREMGDFSGKAHITDYALMREKEAEKALKVLGVSDYQFLRFPDRRLAEQYKESFERLSAIAGDFVPDTIYSPSMIELNPDHRAASGIAIDLQKARGTASKDTIPCSLIFYEVTTPLRPNLIVDVTSVYKKKMKALQQYRSQLELADYLGYIKALNELRTLTVSLVRKRAWGFVKGCRYAEAFWRADRPLADEDITAWLSFREGIRL